MSTHHHNSSSNNDDHNPQGSSFSEGGGSSSPSESSVPACGCNTAATSSDDDYLEPLAIADTFDIHTPEAVETPPEGSPIKFALSLLGDKITETDAVVAYVYETATRNLRSTVKGNGEDLAEIFLNIFLAGQEPHSQLALIIQYALLDACIKSDEFFMRFENLYDIMLHQRAQERNNKHPES